MEFKEYLFSEFVNINPTIRLDSSKEYSFVEMKDLEASKKYVYPSTVKKVTGGARFQNNDTLFARITPCLENGKICQVKNLKNNIGFGSTEFLVFRGIEGISDTNFIFYLARYNEVRRFAEQHLIGTSGRQRVAKNAFDNLVLTLPNLQTQTRIAAILTSLDDKIELNRQINTTLEAMAQTLFEEMCLPKKGIDIQNRNVIKLGDLIDTISVTHKMKKEKIIFLNTSDILEGIVLHNNYSFVSTLPGQAKKSIQQNDILFSEIRPANKRYAFVHFEADDYVVSTKLMVLRSKGKMNSYLVYCFLTRQETLNQLQELADSRSGTFPQITFSQLKELELTMPNDLILNDLNNKIKTLYEKIFLNNQEIQTLTTLRDSLLPKLMRGEIYLS